MANLLRDGPAHQSILPAAAATAAHHQLPPYAVQTVVANNTLAQLTLVQRLQVAFLFLDRLMRLAIALASCLNLSAPNEPNEPNNQADTRITAARCHFDRCNPSTILHLENFCCRHSTRRLTAQSAGKPD